METLRPRSGTAAGVPTRRASRGVGEGVVSAEVKELSLEPNHCTI